jgi:hypothetical protein
MARFSKQFYNDDYNQGGLLFNNVNAWLQENFSELDEHVSGNDTDTSRANFSRWAKSLLMYIRTKGERTELMEKASFACAAKGEGWATAYISNMSLKFNEVVISIDDDAQAIQFKLACL